ncbi:hypothetical protein D2T29_13820 [Sinirhodobacter populi]|uniref:Uncharacterized protein n=1 Tax=Paenirhodobacter populi TaxID=2306993 RepID=A0A443KAX8_9RHOB|nr:hypothetical protein [Sinirhodobacter populi]RWR29856.1 hypothetical protein D2T29_13820 [Sinirhodobacter populi]
MDIYRLTMPIVSDTHARPAEPHLCIHPLALPAFDTLSTLGCLETLNRIGRAVPGQGADLLVYSGFGVLALPSSERHLVVEDGLAPAAISQAAWDEVAAVLRILSASVSARRAFAQTLAQHAPDDQLQDFFLAPDRNTKTMLQRIGGQRRIADEEQRATIFQAALRQFKRLST